MTNSLIRAAAGAGSRLLFHLFALAALVGFFCAIYLYLQTGKGEFAVMVEEPNRVLNDLIPERDYEVAFHVHNQSGRLARVVGMGIT